MCDQPLSPVDPDQQTDVEETDSSLNYRVRFGKALEAKSKEKVSG